MGILRRLREKYLWASPRTVQDKIDELYRRVEHADAGINSNIDFKFDRLLFPMLEEMKRTIESHDTKQDMFNWQFYRQPGETLDEAKRRFFGEMEPATGPLRVFQLGTAQLMGEFDELCREAGLEYWLGGGTLIGAVRHAGFIPWDDDADLCMMRSDLDRLIELVRKDDRYRVTVVYDSFAICKQIRFMFSEEGIPCFLDIFMFDYASSLDMSVVNRHTELRKQLEEEVLNADEFAEWRAVGCLSEDDPRADSAKRLFERYLSRAEDEGLIGTRVTDQMIRSLDNFDDPNGHRWFCAMGEVFPLERAPFEGREVSLPRNSMRFLTESYGNIYELPKDVGSHFDHVSKAEMRESHTVEAIQSKLDSTED